MIYGALGSILANRLVINGLIIKTTLLIDGIRVEDMGTSTLLIML